MPPLSCYCVEWDGDGVGWNVPNNFTNLNTKKGRRCQSCKTIIKPGNTCLEFERFRYPQSEIELKIYSEEEELPMASHYLCEHCGEIFINLDDMKFCITPYENMDELLKEYQQDIVKDNGLFSCGQGG
jgi:hypothetical protein